MKKDTSAKKKTLKGTVVSDKMTGSVVVLVERYVKHSKYKKYMKKQKRYKADDAEGQYHIGDRVVIVKGQVLGGIGGIRQPGLANREIRGDGEEKAGAEAMGGAHQTSQVHGLANTLDADCEIATHGGESRTGGASKASSIALGLDHRAHSEATGKPRPGGRTADELGKSVCKTSYRPLRVLRCARQAWPF